MATFRYVMNRNESLSHTAGFPNKLTGSQTLSDMAVTLWLDGVDKTSDFTISSVAASTTEQTDLRGKVHPIGHAVVWTVAPKDTATASEYEYQVKATLVETGEKLIAQTVDGDAPILKLGQWGEA